MAENTSLSQLVALAAQLPVAERRQLAETILRDLASEAQAANPPRRRAWSEIRGMAPYPLCGEDAQQWITRSRRESDEQREKGVRGK